MQRYSLKYLFLYSLILTVPLFSVDKQAPALDLEAYIGAIEEDVDNLEILENESLSADKLVFSKSGFNFVSLDNRFYFIRRKVIKLQQFIITGEKAPSLKQFPLADFLLWYARLGWYP